jgi:serine phosphatase RsbU (regulator of sigma subunit)/CHASE3 domain sensor protein
VRLSLRRKIVGGFGLLLALIALLGYVTLSLFGSLRNVQSRVFDDAIPGLVAVDEIVRSYTAQSAAIRGYLIDPRPELLEQYNRELASASVAENRAENLFRSEIETALLDDLQTAGITFHTLVEEEIIPLAEEGFVANAISKLTNEGTPLLSEIETLGRLLRQEQDRVVTGTQSQAQSASNQTIAILLVVIIGTLLIGIAMAFLLPRRLSADLGRLVQAARAIGRGDLEQRVEIHSGDEIEELAERFTEMTSGLKRLQQLALQDRELEIASAIQRGLLQRTLPDTPGVRLLPSQRQANLVGGDWYDVDSSGNTVTVVVGDASGKGIAAALMATVVLSVLRAERRLGSPAKRVIARANEALRGTTESDAFTTLTYATIDRTTGETAWLNMGHPAPFLIRASGGQGGPRGYYLEGPRNRVLGWFDDPGLAETMIRLEPGDRLVFYTDGFLEAKSTDGEVFGEHRFAESMNGLASLDSEQILEEIGREVERFAAGKLDDDLTMLIVEFQGATVRADTEQSRGDETWHSRR